MKLDFSGLKIYLRTGRTDMRKAINGLAILVQNEMGLPPYGGSLFLFSNGHRHLKILYWDKNGFCLWQKRLEKHRFPWPKSDTGTMSLTSQELNWLLSGIDFFRAHEELNFFSVS